MPLPPITRFTSVDTKASSTNKNNGLYAPELTQAQIDSIPTSTKRNGGMWYNTSLDRLETVVNNNILPVTTGPGGGDVIGPGVSVTDNIVTFANTTGTQISDSGIAKDNLVIGVGAATANKLVEFTGTNKEVQESPLIAANLVSNSGAGAEGNIAIFDASGGKVIQDSGVNITQIPVPPPAFRASSLMRAPNVTVNEISNLGHLKFTNDLGIIFVDTLMPVEFITNNTGLEDQVCSLFTGGLPSSSTSPSALVELQSDSGALLLSRMTTTERDLLVTPADAHGMLLFNKTSTTFDGFDGNDWRKFALFNTDDTLNVADPISSFNAATKNYVDTAIGSIPSATVTLNGDVTGTGIITSPIVTTLALTLDQINAPAANLNLNNKNIINLADPINAQEAGTKNYIDTRSITLSGAVSGTGFLGTTIATTLANITTSQISDFNTAVVAFRLDQFAIPTADINLNNQKILNLAPPILATDATNKGYVDSAISGSGFAPGTSKYIIQTSDPALPNAQILGSLTTGLLKNTTTTGILTTAIAGTDYYSPGNPTRIIDNAVNFFIGTSSGNLALTGTSNTGVGITSLESLTTGTDNTATGNSALKQNTLGLSNSAFGARTLANNITGSGNSAFGVESLLNNTSDANSAFGYQSLKNNTGGNSNSSFGYQSLLNNLLGFECCSFGVQSLLNSNAQGNSAFGYLSMQLNTSGSLNSSFGWKSLTSNTTGSLNTALGSSALQALTTGSSNVACGTGTLLSITNSSYNSAFGAQALFQTTLGGNNTAGGFQALGSNTLGANNTALGYRAGYNQTLNNNCLFLGYGADASVNTLTNSIAIGYQASVGASNCMVLGGTGANAIFVGIGVTPNGEFQLSNSQMNRKIVLYQTANNDHQIYSLGTNNQVFRFQLDGANSFFIFYVGTSSTSSDELMRLTGTGSLVVGGINALARISAVGGVQNVTNEDTCIRATSNLNAAKIEVYNNSLNGRLWEFRSLNTGNFDIYDRIANASRVSINTSGTLYANQSYASYYGVGSGATLVPTVTLFFKATWPSTSVSTLVNDFTLGSSRFTYTGSSSRIVSITVSLTATTNGAPGANGELTTFAISKNNVNIATISDVVLSASASVASVTLNIITQAAPNDFFELWVAHSTTANRTVTIQNLCYTISST